MEMKYVVIILVMVVVVSAFLATNIYTGKAYKVISKEEPTAQPVQAAQNLVPAKKTSYIYSNDLTARFENGVLKYYHQDNLGSNSLVTEGSGSVSSNFKNEPYGKEIMTEKSNPEEAYKYTGKPLDSTTGLYYYGARFYDTSTGRFTNADPILRIGSNYAYAANNPMIMIDRMGMGEDDKNKKDYTTYTSLNLGYDFGAQKPLLDFSLGVSHNDFSWLRLYGTGGLGVDPFNQGRSFYGGSIVFGDMVSLAYKRMQGSDSKSPTDQYSVGFSGHKIKADLTLTKPLSQQGSYAAGVSDDTYNNYPDTLTESFSLGPVYSIGFKGTYDVYRKSLGKEGKYDFVLSPGLTGGILSNTEPVMTGPTGVVLEPDVASGGQPYSGGRRWFGGPLVDARFERSDKSLMLGAQIGAIFVPKSQEAIYGLGMKPNGEPKAHLEFAEIDLIRDSLYGKVYLQLNFGGGKK